MSADKTEARRLADALQFVPLAVAKTAAAMLRRWPDGEPVAWLYEARYIDTAWTVCVGLNNPGPEGAYLRGVRPLYTAPPAESERIAAPTSAQFDDVAWLWTHCRSLGMQKKSLSGSMRDDVGLFARDQNDRIAALEAEKQANYEHWRNAEIDLERHRAALKVAREALEGWRSVDVHSALTEDEADAIKAKDDAALRAIEGVQHG